MKREKNSKRDTWLPGVKIFTIVTRNPSDPVTYEIADYSGEKIKGKIYELELQRIVKEDDVYITEKVLKSRKRGSKKEYSSSGLDIQIRSIAGSQI